MLKIVRELTELPRRVRRNAVYKPGDDGLLFECLGEVAASAGPGHVEDFQIDGKHDDERNIERSDCGVDDVAGLLTKHALIHPSYLLDNSISHLSLHLGQLSLASLRGRLIEYQLRLE